MPVEEKVAAAGNPNGKASRCLSAVLTEGNLRLQRNQPVSDVALRKPTTATQWIACDNTHSVNGKPAMQGHKREHSGIGGSAVSLHRYVFSGLCCSSVYSKRLSTSQDWELRTNCAAAVSQTVAGR